MGPRVRRGDRPPRSEAVMSDPRLSVVIPTRDGDATLPALLDSIWSQRTHGFVEIIAIDSGSSDGTLDLLAWKATGVIEVEPSAFDHGATRNLAIARARGEFIVLLAQDARLTGENCLEALTRPFASNPMLAGTFARQLPHPDASALTRHYHARWIASTTEERRADLGGGRDGLERMSPAERLALCAFDNVASCIRRSVWEPLSARACSKRLRSSAVKARTGSYGYLQGGSASIALLWLSLASTNNCANFLDEHSLRKEASL